jgi:hypothetical protein|eukprot:COSAG06_NODE_2031_length_7795_cov_114.657225_4_plen_51_part_00
MARSTSSSRGEYVHEDYTAACILIPSGERDLEPLIMKRASSAVSRLCLIR